MTRKLSTYCPNTCLTSTISMTRQEIKDGKLTIDTVLSRLKASTLNSKHYNDLLELMEIVYKKEGQTKLDVDLFAAVDNDVIGYRTFTLGQSRTLLFYIADDIKAKDSIREYNDDDVTKGIRPTLFNKKIHHILVIKLEYDNDDSITSSETLIQIS